MCKNTNKVFWRAKEMREGASQGDSKTPMKKINKNGQKTLSKKSDKERLASARY